MISPASASISATTSWIRVRTMRFFRRASVEGAFQTIFKSSASIANEASVAGAVGGVCASWEMRASTLAHPFERPVPAQFEFRRHEAVGGIDGVILTEGTIRRIARGLKIPVQGVAHIVASCGCLAIGLDCRRDRAGLNHLQDHRLDGVVHPQTAEGDAARLAIVEPAAAAAVARDIVAHAGVSDRQLAPAPPTADKPSKQRVTVLGGAMVLSARRVVADHLAEIGRAHV